MSGTFRNHSEELITHACMISNRSGTHWDFLMRGRPREVNIGMKGACARFRYDLYSFFLINVFLAFFICSFYCWIKYVLLVINNRERREDEEYGEVREVFRALV